MQRITKPRETQTRWRTIFRLRSDGRSSTALWILTTGLVSVIFGLTFMSSPLVCGFLCRFHLSKEYRNPPPESSLRGGFLVVTLSYDASPSLAGRGT